MVRRSVCEWGLLLLAAVAAPSVGAAQTEVPRRDRVRIAEAMRLADELGDEIWLGWRDTPMRGSARSGPGRHYRAVDAGLRLSIRLGPRPAGGA